LRHWIVHFSRLLKQTDIEKTGSVYVVEFQVFR